MPTGNKIFDPIAIPKGASRVGRLDPDRRIDFTVVLAAKNSLPSIHSLHSPRPAHQSRQLPHLTHAELDQTYGAVPGGVELIESFAHKFKLEIIETAVTQRSIRLCGSAASVGKAFATSFDEFELDGHRFFCPVRPPKPPKEWNGAVEALLGLYNLRQARPRRHSAVHGQATSSTLHNLAQAYRFPPGLDGTGETIGLIEFSGGFYPEDIEQFCSRIGVAAPRVTVVKIGRGANQPVNRRSIHEFLGVVDGTLKLAAKAEQSDSFVAAQCTAEVTMDIEVVAALAPGAHIVVYFASTDEQGLYHAINRAVHDEQHRPGILSISWSIPEHTLPSSEIQAIEGVLHEAAHLGITVCASSGDAGAINGSSDGKPSVNYPASSPHCLACGGTSGKMAVTGIAEEVVWNATHYGIKGASGGGVSERFDLPIWQKNAKVPKGPEGRSGRGVPDVAGLADPRDGCELLIAGRPFTSAGTSAVAPMWAALVARLNQALGRRSGHLHSHIYRLCEEHTTALRPVLKGNNGVYKAGKGWNACTGYGTPRGDELLAHLKKHLLS